MKQRFPAEQRSCALWHLFRVWGCPLSSGGRKGHSCRWPALLSIRRSRFHMTQWRPGRKEDRFRASSPWQVRLNLWSKNPAGTGHQGTPALLLWRESCHSWPQICTAPWAPLAEILAAAVDSADQTRCRRNQSPRFFFWPTRLSNVSPGSGRQIGWMKVENSTGLSRRMIAKSSLWKPRFR